MGDKRKFFVNGERGPIGVDKVGTPHATSQPGKAPCQTQTTYDRPAGALLPERGWGLAQMHYRVKKIKAPKSIRGARAPPFIVTVGPRIVVRSLSRERRNCSRGRVAASRTRADPGASRAQRQQRSAAEKLLTGSKSGVAHTGYRPRAEWLASPACSRAYIVSPSARTGAGNLCHARFLNAGW